MPAVPAVPPVPVPVVPVPPVVVLPDDIPEDRAGRRGPHGRPARGAGGRARAGGSAACPGTSCASCAASTAATSTASRKGGATGYGERRRQHQRCDLYGFSPSLINEESSTGASRRSFRRHHVTNSSCKVLDRRNSTIVARIHSDFPDSTIALIPGQAPVSLIPPAFRMFDERQADRPNGLPRLRPGDPVPGAPILAIGPCERWDAH